MCRVSKTSDGGLKCPLQTERGYKLGAVELMGCHRLGEACVLVKPMNSSAAPTT